MKYLSKLSYTILLLTAICIYTSCDDNTATIGLVPGNDVVSPNQSVYKVFSKSIKIDSVLANTEECYLGKILDPETKTITSGDFLAQFYLLEEFAMPEEKSIVKNGNGEIEADSIDLRLYIKSYYGDSLNMMKIGVYELDTANIMKEDKSYYTNIEAKDFVNKNSSAIRKELQTSVVNLSIDDSIRNLSSYTKNICVKLPKEYGTFILNQYYKHPEYFKNSYNFIRHVCPGFYIKALSGVGTMMNVDISALSIYFRYNLKDSIYEGVQRMAATEEVLQNTHIENKGLDPLIKETQYSYLKTPSGIFTEVTLPIDSIFNDKHYNDTLNSAKISFQRYNNSSQDKYNLDIPSEILMVRSSNLYDFFEKNKTPDNKTSYAINFNPIYNSYIFSNISNLVSYCKNIRNAGAEVKESDTPATRKAKYKEWEAKNPDWNKVVLLPVITTANSAGTITKVRNELWLTSTRLTGGETGNLTISVVYSGFQKK
ncbi:MAG: DUF4270 domain-containing protein [Bacteroidaceae bacterium]